METIKRVLVRDEFARRSGIELVSLAPGCARAEMRVQPHHLNAVGSVQGGAIFTLADFAFAAASNSHGTVAVAINVNISFLKAVTTGLLIAEARELTRGHRLGTYTVEVKDEQGDLVAIFQGMVYRKQDKLPSSGE